MDKLATPICCTWDISHIVTESEFLLYKESDKRNLVTTVGKDDVLALILALDGSGPIIAGAAGACSTAADASDTHLNYEHILNSQRMTLTNTSDLPLSSSDIQSDVVTIDGCEYTRKIVVRYRYDGSTDANVNQPFQEYALMSSITLPGTPTGVSGTMFNHYVAAAPIVLESTTTIIVDITIRI